MQDDLNKSPLDKPSTEGVALVKSDEDEDNDDDDDLHRFVNTLENKSDSYLKPKPPDSSLLLNKSKCAQKKT